MKHFTLLDNKTTRSTINSTLTNAGTVASDLTNAICSAIINFWSEGYNPALSGYVMNQLQNHKTAPKKITNAGIVFMSKFIAMQSKKDDTGKIVKNNDGVVYQKNEDKLNELLAEAVKADVDVSKRDDLVDYFTSLIEAELKALGGTVLGQKKRTPKTEAEKYQAKLNTFTKSLDILSVTDIIDALESKGVLDAIIDIKGFQVNVTQK